MYIKPFKKKHLHLLGPFNVPASSRPKSGWMVIEDGRVLALGFLRLIEGDMAAMDGPYGFEGTPSPRAKEAVVELEKYIRDMAQGAGLSLVRLKPYKPLS